MPDDEVKMLELHPEDMADLVNRSTAIINAVMQVQIHGSDTSYRNGFRRGTTNRYAVHETIADLIASAHMSGLNLKTLTKLIDRRVEFLQKSRKDLKDAATNSTSIA